MESPAPSSDVPASGRTAPSDPGVLVATLRALLRARSRPEAADVLQSAIRQLGGAIVPAREAGESDLPVDVSLGVGEPLVVRPPHDESAAQFLTAHVAELLEDAAWAALRSDQHQRATMRASIDTLTRVASRAEIGPRLGLSVSGDAVCLLDLDNFKRLNDTRGHQAGDLTLQSLGALLLDHIRDVDFAGRYGGDEFAIVLRSTTAEVACGRMRVLAERWFSSGDHGTSISVGVAGIDPRGGAVAVGAADRALYRAKRSGRGRVEQAVPDDYAEVGS